jgi:hypothetical protein
LRSTWAWSAGAVRGSCSIVTVLRACASDCVQGVAEAECRRAAAAAEEVYIREFDQEGTPADADALLQEHLVGARPQPAHYSHTSPIAVSVGNQQQQQQKCNYATARDH